MIDIKVRRQQLGLTMKEVAEIAGVSESAVSRWESGDIDNMRRDKIVSLAKALRVSPIDLLGDTTLVAIPLGEHSGNIDEIIVRYQNMNEEQKQLVLQLVRNIGGGK